MNSKDLYSIYLERDELAEKLGGGIPKGSIVFIEGEEGSGRSVLCQRLGFGVLKNGHSLTYISTEMTVKDFIDQMYSLDYLITNHLSTGKLMFIPVYPIIGNPRPKGDFLHKLTTSHQLYRNDVIVIDSFSSLVDADDSTDLLAFMSFLKKMANQNKTIILTAEKGKRGLDPLRLASDLYIDLNMKVGGDGIKRMIQVKRYIRARDRVDEMVGFRIEPGIGLVIEITEVSG
jgi:flagellar protein FlaH